MRKDFYQDLYEKEETHWWHRAKRRYVKWIISTHTAKKKQTTLDVGCGTGKNMEELSSFGEVWGVDISDEALSFCKKRGLTHIKKGEAENLPFNDDTFDVVCALDVLEHVDDKLAVKEIKKVLKDDGFIVITVPAYDWLWSRWDEVLGHKRRYTKKQLGQVLEKEGFVIRRYTYIHALLILPLFIFRKIKQLQSKPYSSDFKVGNNIMNKILLYISELEQMMINRYDMPFGTSILCIAQKRNEKYKSP